MKDYEGLLPPTPAVIRRIPGLASAIGMNGRSWSRRALYKIVEQRSDIDPTDPHIAPVPLIVSHDAERLTLVADLDLAETARRFSQAVLRDQYVPVIVHRRGRIAKSLIEKQLGLRKRDPRVLPQRYLAAQHALAFTIEPTAVLGTRCDDWAVALFYVSSSNPVDRVPASEVLLLVYKDGTARLYARPALGFALGATSRKTLENRIRLAVPAFRRSQPISLPGFGLYELPRTVRLTTELPYDETAALGRILIEDGNRKHRPGSSDHQIGKSVMGSRLRRSEMRAYGLLLKASPDRLADAMTALIRQKGNQPKNRVPGADTEINYDIDLLIRLTLWLADHPANEAERIQRAALELPAAFSVPESVPKSKALGNVVAEYGALMSSGAVQVEFPFTAREAIKALSLAVPFSSAFHQARTPEDIIDYIEVLSLLRRHHHHVRPQTAAEVKRIKALKTEVPISGNAFRRAAGLINRSSLYSVGVATATKEAQLLTRYRALIDRKSGRLAPMPVGLIDVHAWLTQCFKALPMSAAIALAHYEPSRVASCLAEYALLSPARRLGVEALRKLDKLWHQRINRIMDDEEKIRLSVLGIADDGRRQRLYPKVPFDLPDGVVQIRTTSGLKVEGTEMDNCVRTFDIPAAAGDCLILSVVTARGRTTAEIRMRPVYVAHQLQDLEFVLSQHEAKRRGKPPRANAELLRQLLKQWNRGDEHSRNLRFSYDMARQEACKVQRAIGQELQTSMTPQQSRDYANRLLPLLRPYLPKAYRHLSADEILVTLAKDVGLELLSPDGTATGSDGPQSSHREGFNTHIEWAFDETDLLQPAYRPRYADADQEMPF